MSFVATALTSLAIGAAGTLAAAIGLTFSQSPEVPTATDGLDFSGTLNRGITDPQPIEQYEARDGTRLDLRAYPSGRADAPLVILLHGSGWHGLQFNDIARKLAEGGHADVLAPDLRGHGQSPKRRGDVDYIGQFEDDIADLIKNRARVDQPVILAGHSSGGGLVIRFAGGKHGSMLTKAVLLAPFLKYNAPTIRAQSGGWAHTATRRLIGLSMLNGVGISAFNHLPVIAFNMPETVMNGPLAETVTNSYSFRLNTSFAPRSDYLGDVAKLPPFLLLAGDADEAFDASQFQPTLEAVTNKGTYRLLPGVGHLDLIDENATLAAITAFISK